MLASGIIEYYTDFVIKLFRSNLSAWPASEYNKCSRENQGTRRLKKPACIIVQKSSIDRRSVHHECEIQ